LAVTNNLDPDPPSRLKVRAAADWASVNHRLDGFHDGLVKEVRFVDDTYVDERRNMVFGRESVLSVFIQLQDDVQPAAELLFHGVRQIVLDPAVEVTPGTVVTSGNDLVFEFLSCEVRAREADVLLLDSSSLGNRPFRSLLLDERTQNA
jgi:hypothetical protein